MTKDNYIKRVRRALEAARRYTPALDIQITALASALMSLDIADHDIACLNEWDRYCGNTLKEHPAFKIQRNMLENVTRQMRALGLTADQLGGADEQEESQLIALTKTVLEADKG